MKIWVTYDAPQEKNNVGLYAISQVVNILNNNDEIWIVSEVIYSFINTPISYYSCLNENRLFGDISQKTALNQYFGYKLCPDLISMLNKIKKIINHWSLNSSEIDKIISNC